MSIARRSWQPSDDHGTWGRRFAALASTAGMGTALAFVAFGSMRAGLGTREAGAEFGGSWQQALASTPSVDDGVIDVPAERPSLQAALDACRDGMTVRLARGVHAGGARVVARGVTIVGAGSGETSIRGGGNGPVLTVLGDGNATVSLRGLSITGGTGRMGTGLRAEGVRLQAEDVRIAGNEGGGAWLTATDVRFSACVFEGNRTAGSGGAVLGDASELSFVSCRFEGNEAASLGGAVHGSGGSASFLACTFEGNATRSGAWGGAVFGRDASVRVDGSDFARNRAIEAGGAVCVLGGTAEVSGCTFEANTSETGRGLFARGAGLRIVGSRLCGSAETAVGGEWWGEGNTFDAACFGDCDQDGTPDAEAIARGWVTDRDGNGVPDSCDPDCNMNGIADGYEIAMGFSQDLNGNGMIDFCEIRAGLVRDDNHDWVPDEVQGVAVVREGAGAGAGASPAQAAHEAAGAMDASTDEAGGGEFAFGTEPWAMPAAPAVEPPASFDPARWGPGIKAPPMAAGRR
jgi:hypothetical protein